MRKVFLFIAPLLISTGIFLGILYYLDYKSSKGALQITSNSRSKVYLNNKLIGETPVCLCELPQMIQVGDYNIKVVSSDTSFKPFEEKITINKSILTVVDRTFSKDGSSGSVVSLSPLSNKKDIEILVESVPSKANIFLDSNPVGTTTLLLKNVGEAGHDIRVGKEGFKEKLIKIKTTLGYRLVAKIFLGTSDFSDIASESGKIASSSASLEGKKVLILDTPTGFLRIREENSIGSLEIGRVNPGESYELLNEKNGWFQIRFDSPAGEEKKGWISAQYAKKQ